MQRLLPAAVVTIAVAASLSGRTLESPPQVRDDTWPVTLLPGYHHRAEQGIDTAVGRIWKNGGPDIGYDLGFLGGNAVLSYAERFPEAFTARIASAASAPVILWTSEKYTTVVVSIEPLGSFVADDVASNREVAEVLLMISTYWRKTRDFAAPSPGIVNGIAVLRGYLHQQIPRSNPYRGRIWRDNGPEIRYELGDNGSNQARAYAQRNRTAWSLAISDSTVVTMDEARQMLIVSDFYTNFTATGVKTRRDVAEVMLTALTHDIFEAWHRQRR